MKTITKICIKKWTLKKNQNSTKSPWNGTLYSSSGLRQRNIIHNNVVALSRVICFPLKVQRKTSSIHLRGLQISNLNAPNIKHTPYWHCFYSYLIQGNQPPHSILAVHSSLSYHHTDTHTYTGTPKDHWIMRPPVPCPHPIVPWSFHVFGVRFKSKREVFNE